MKYHNSIFCVNFYLQCDAGVGTNALYDQLYSSPTKLLVVGAGCSAVSQATAQASHLWNLIQVTDLCLYTVKQITPLYIIISVSSPTRLLFCCQSGYSTSLTSLEPYASKG